MTDLSPESKALIELARADDEPTAADRARVRRALGASLATGIAASSATSFAAGAGAKAAAAGATAGLAGTLKIAMWVGIGMALGAATTGAVVFATHDKTPDRALAPRVSAREPVMAVVPSREEPAPEGTAIGMATIPLEVSAKSASTKTPPPSPSSLTAEMRLLETARAALSSGDARRALTLIEQHERDYPTGALVEERRASKVFALCELGRRSEAARAASEFLRTAPTSPLRGRVLDSCGFR